MTARPYTAQRHVPQWSDASMLDDEISAAIAESHLAALPAETLSQIVADGVRLDVRAGMTLVQEGARGPVAEIVVKGLMRTYMTAANGRQITVRYSRKGALIGIPSLFTPWSDALGLQALVDSRILVLRPAGLQELARRDARVALALLVETSERARGYVEELGSHAFASLRQRLARHLLDLAVVEPDGAGGHAPVAQVSHQELADAAGTMREVVVRILRDLRSDGLVSTGRRGIVLLDAARLHAEIWSRSG